MPQLDSYECRHDVKHTEIDRRETVISDDTVTGMALMQTKVIVTYCAECGNKLKEVDIVN